VCVDNTLTAASSLGIGAPTGSQVKCRLRGNPECNVIVTVIDTGSATGNMIDLLPGAVNQLLKSCGKKPITPNACESWSAALECTVLRKGGGPKDLKDKPGLKPCKCGKDCYKHAQAEHCV